MWHLYDIVRDPGEVNDLQNELPERFAQMLSAYENYARQNRVLPLPAGYSQGGQLLTNLLAERTRTGFIVLLLTILVLTPFLVAWRMKGSTARR